VRSKLVPVAEAAAAVRSGDTVAVGGSLLRRQPMALIREVIRAGTTDLSLLTWASSLATDALVGAGAVRHWEGIYVGMWWHGSAPSFRRAVEAGAVTTVDRSESYMTARLRAAAMGVPFLPVQPILGAGVSAVSDILPITCPYTSAELLAVPAATPDVTILHGYVGDEYGNVAWPAQRDSDDVDMLMASGSRRLVVSVERIVPHDRIARTPNLTYIPHTKVDMICEAPFGAYPGSCDTFYDEDEAEIAQWFAAGRDPDRWSEYLARTVLDVPDHDAFVALVGEERLRALEVHA
jgi:glutaconate CoA-transferase, subunit A